MARPKLQAGDVPTKERIEESLLELLEVFPIDEITVSMIVVRAKCNRGSFYYHFQDIDALVSSAIERYFPAKIPQILLSWFNGADASVDDALNLPQFKREIDILCRLVGPHSSLAIIAMVKQRFQEAWLDALDMNVADISQDMRILFEFLMNGVVGIMSYRANGNMHLEIKQRFEAIFPELPEAFMKRVLVLREER